MSWQGSFGLLENAHLFPVLNQVTLSGVGDRCRKPEDNSDRTYPNPEIHVILGLASGELRTWFRI